MMVMTLIPTYFIQLSTHKRCFDVVTNVFLTLGRRRFNVKKTFACVLTGLRSPYDGGDE